MNHIGIHGRVFDVFSRKVLCVSDIGMFVLNKADQLFLDSLTVLHFLDLVIGDSRSVIRLIGRHLLRLFLLRVGFDGFAGGK